MMSGAYLSQLSHGEGIRNMDFVNREEIERKLARVVGRGLHGEKLSLDHPNALASLMEQMQL